MCRLTEARYNVRRHFFIRKDVPLEMDERFFTTILQQKQEDLQQKSSAAYKNKYDRKELNFQIHFRETESM